MSIPINELERYLGLPEDFFHALQSEDDWSFIVKIHSLIETTCNSLLVEEFGKPETLDAFVNVPMGTVKSGKLAFIKSLDLLPKKDISFIEQIGWLRNKFVHNVSRTQSSLQGFIENQSKEKQKELYKAFAGTIESVRTNDIEFSGIEFAKKFPAQSIWVTSTRVLEFMRLRIIGGKIQEHLNENGPVIIRGGEVELL